MIMPRKYQQDSINEIYKAWERFNDVCFVLPTGGGKSFTMAFIIRDFVAQGKKCIIMVHRRELILQLSHSLAMVGVQHNLVANNVTKKLADKQHKAEFGRMFRNQLANVTVASVQTLINKKDLHKWGEQFDLKLGDEFHHTLLTNTWGKCWEALPNALGLGVTATPARTDGFGLGRHADGVADIMVLGPSMAELISMGNLCKYRIFAPPANVDFSKLKIGSGGEYTEASIDDAMTKFQCSEPVREYQKVMNGEQAIVFAHSLDKSKEIAQAFNDAGIPAASVSSKDDDEYRAQCVEDFKNGKLKILTNFSLFAEGFDIPGLVGVIDCALTNSLIQFHQRFGRMLRPKQGKSFGIYIDLVGNIKTQHRGKHALPDSQMYWSLDRRKKQSKDDMDDVPSLRTCINEVNGVMCMAAYDPSVNDGCPVCGHIPAKRPTGSAGEIAEVDQELVELTPADLDMLRGAIDKARQDPNDAMQEKFHGLQNVAAYSFRKAQKNRIEILESLDHEIATWAAVWRDIGMSDNEIHGIFRKSFKIGIYDARALNGADAAKLVDKIKQGVA